MPDNNYGYVVDVNDHVNLVHTKLEFIPIKFNNVTGNFDCETNSLTSLEFSPQVVGGYFNCSVNKLTSLEFSPQVVGSYFDCSVNQLTSLEFCPQKVGSNFYCWGNAKLNELQEIDNFSIIYQEHLRFKEKKEFAHKLEQELDISSNSTRIKI